MKDEIDADWFIETLHTYVDVDDLTDAEKAELKDEVYVSPGDMLRYVAAMDKYNEGNGDGDADVEVLERILYKLSKMQEVVLETFHYVVNEEFDDIITRIGDQKGLNSDQITKIKPILMTSYWRDCLSDLGAYEF
jgi:hypothetical protein